MFQVRIYLTLFKPNRSTNNSSVQWIAISCCLSSNAILTHNTFELDFTQFLYNLHYCMKCNQLRLIVKMCFLLHFAPKMHLYNSLHFPAEINTSCSKTPTFLPFHTNFDYRSRLSINKYLFLGSSLHNINVKTFLL